MDLKALCSSLSCKLGYPAAACSLLFNGDIWTMNSVISQAIYFYVLGTATHLVTDYVNFLYKVIFL